MKTDDMYSLKKAENFRKVTGNPIFPLINPALVFVPLGFLGGVIGTLVSKEYSERKYAEVKVRANTGGFRQL